MSDERTSRTESKISEIIKFYEIKPPIPKASPNTATFLEGAGQETLLTLAIRAEFTGQKDYEEVWRRLTGPNVTRVINFSTRQSSVKETIPPPTIWGESERIIIICTEQLLNPEVFKTSLNKVSNVFKGDERVWVLTEEVNCSLRDGSYVDMEPGDTIVLTQKIKDLEL